MRLAILSAPRCPVVTGRPWPNGAHPRALPMLLSDRIANGEAFPGERVVRLPRRFARMDRLQAQRILLGLSDGDLAAEG